MRSYTLVETDLGWVGLLRSSVGLKSSTLPCSTAFAALQRLKLQPADVDAEEAEFADAIRFVRSLLAGQPCRSCEPLDLSGGTTFQRTVWLAVQGIPFGQTRSYRWVAEEIGRPLAAHAVGQAIANNPLALFVPCHRVVAANGDLGGYGHGADALPTKRSLLRCEGVRFAGATLEQIRGLAAESA